MATIFFEDIEGEVDCFNVDQDFNEKLEAFYLKWNDKIKNEIGTDNLFFEGEYFNFKPILLNNGKLEMNDEFPLHEYNSNSLVHAFVMQGAEFEQGIHWGENNGLLRSNKLVSQFTNELLLLNTSVDSYGRSGITLNFFFVVSDDTSCYEEYSIEISSNLNEDKPLISFSCDFVDITCEECDGSGYTDNGEIECEYCDGTGKNHG